MGKKNTIKTKILISLQRLFNLTDVDGKTIFITWRRGSKHKNRGQTKKVEVKSGMAVLGEEFSLDCTLQQDQKSNKFEGKKLELLIKTEDGKKSTEYAKLIVDLGTYGSAGKHEGIILPLELKKKDKSGKEPSIKMDVTTTWTHFNKKKITEKKGDGKGVEIGGVEYGLESESEDISDDETTMGDMSEGEDDDLDEFDDEDEDEKEKEKEKSKGKDKEKDKDKEKEKDKDKRKSKRGSKLISDGAISGLESGTISTSSTSTIPKSASSSNLPAHASSSSSEILLDEEKDKQIKKLEKEISRLKDELADEKGKARDKHMQATGSKQEIKKLKKELAEAKKNMGKKGTGSDEEIKKKDDEIHALNEKLDTALKDNKELQAELKRSSREVSVDSVNAKELEKVKKDTEALRRDLDSSRKELAEKNATIDKMKSSLQEKENELKEKNKSYLQLKDELQMQMQSQAATKAGDSIRGSSAAQAEALERARKLEDEVANLKRELEIAKKEAKAAKSELEEVNTELEVTSKKLADSKKEVENLKRASNRTGSDEKARVSETEFNSLKDELEKTKQALASRTSALKNLEKDYKEKERTVDQLNDNVARLEAQLQKNKKQEIEVASSSSSSSSISAELSSLTQKYETENQALRNEIEELKSKLAKNKAAVEELNQELREKQQTIDNQQKEILKLKESMLVMGGSKDNNNNNNNNDKKDNNNNNESEFEALRKKIQENEQEREEDDLIENDVYCMVSKYKDGTHISAQHLSSQLIQLECLEDPPNERLLSKILRAVKKAYKVVADDNTILVKWLSFACHFHEQLETEVGTSEDENSGDIPENGVHIFRSEEHKGGDEDDDDPVSIFFKNLEMLIYEIYSAYVTNIYAQIDEVIIPGILHPVSTSRPRSSSSNSPRDPTSNGYNPSTSSKNNNNNNSNNNINNSNENKNNSNRDRIDVAGGLTTILTEHLVSLRKHMIFDSVVKQFFCQVFYYINTRLFNDLLHQRELCTCGNGFQIKLGLGQLDEWVAKNDKKNLAVAARRYLQHITEAANVLVVDKAIFEDETMISNVCPTLSIPQVRALLSQFRTDQYSPEPVPKAVLAKLEKMDKSRKSSKGLELDESFLLSLPKN